MVPDCMSSMSYIQTTHSTSPVGGIRSSVTPPRVLPGPAGPTSRLAPCHSSQPPRVVFKDDVTTTTSLCDGEEPVRRTGKGRQGGLGETQDPVSYYVGDPEGSRDDKLNREPPRPVPERRCSFTVSRTTVGLGIV